MNEFIEGIFRSDFMPHAHCYLWHKDVLWLHVISDGCIALAYFTIPAALIYFVKKRTDVVFSWIFVMFALFILGCGMTHVLELWTVWDPIYRLSGLMKAITAVVSVATAVALWKLMPAALAMPSPAQLRSANLERETEFLRRGRAEEELREAHAVLEERVRARTAELAAANEALHAKISEYHRIENELRDNQQQFQAIMDHSPTVIYIRDLESHYRFVNRQFERVFRITSADACGKNARDFLPKTLADDRQRHDRQVVEDGTSLEFEEIVPQEDGPHTYLSIEFPLPGPDGKPQSICGIARDITESKKAAEAVRAAKEEAEEASHAKSEFLSRISHELRTPMNAVLGFGQILEMDPGLTGSQRLSVEHILLGGRHLLILINEVLDISRIEAGEMKVEMESVDAGAVFEACVELLRPLAEQRGIGLSVDPALHRDGRVRADRQRLKQVALNLLSNAIKYNHPNGRVTVTGEVIDSDRIRVVVRDTGQGLSPKDLELCFAPFERLGAEAAGVEGTGLGLALSLRLVRLMEGQLGAESELGVGSSFWVELGRPKNSESEIRHEESVPVAPGLPPTQKRTVLYIEDNLSNLKLIEQTLMFRPGTLLLPAMQGRLGFDLACKHHPDLILLDLHLPDIHGAELLVRLRDEPTTRGIPVLVLSADANPAESRRILAAGARHYLTKPIDVPQFLRIFDELVDELEREKESP